MKNLIIKLISFFKKQMSLKQKLEFDYTKIYDTLEQGNYMGYKIDKEQFFISEFLIRSNGGGKKNGQNYTSEQIN